MWTHVYTRPVYTCTLPGCDWIWQSAEWCCHEQTLCSLCSQLPAAKCPAGLQSHSAADVSQFITTQRGMQLLQWEVTKWTERVISDCRVYYYVRDVHSLMWELVVWWALWEISVDYCSKRVQLMVQVLLKISQTPVSSNIPRWRLRAIKWWMVVPSVSSEPGQTTEQWNPGVIWDKNNKTAQTEVILSVSRDPGLQSIVCLHALPSQQIRL